MSQQRYPVGIDLGAEVSSISYVDEQQCVQTVRLNDGSLTMATAVCFSSPAKTIAGNAALECAAHEAANLARDFRRFLGRRNWSFAVGGEPFSAEQLAALVLRELVVQATPQVGPVEQVVISVPCVFDETKRRAVRRAGEIAGLRVLDIVDEPVAAALAYGRIIRQGGGAGFWGDETLDELFSTEIVLVCGLSGTAFEFTLIQLESNDAFRVLATEVDSQLGINDWDRVLVNYLAREYCRRAGRPLSGEAELMRQLWVEARAARVTLSERSRVSISVRHNSENCSIPVKRGDFERLTGHLAERTLLSLQTMLQRKSMRFGHISFVLLLGEARRMPMIRKMLERELGRELDAGSLSDTAVSQGAALYAAFSASKQLPQCRKSIGAAGENVSKPPHGSTRQEDAQKFRRPSTAEAASKHAAPLVPPDVYRKWLGIPQDQCPPNHYVLLGVAVYEADPAIIRQAADKQIRRVRPKCLKHPTTGSLLLNEIVRARLCLTQPEVKDRYDTSLRQERASVRPVLPASEKRLLSDSLVPAAPAPPTPPEPEFPDSKALGVAAESGETAMERESLPRASYLVEASMRSLPASPEVRELVDEALQLQQRQRVLEAYEALDRALELDPGNPLVHHARAEVFFREGSARWALEENAKALSVAPVSAVWLLHGRCHALLGDLQQTQCDYHQAIKTAQREAEGEAFVAGMEAELAQLFNRS